VLAEQKIKTINKNLAGVMMMHGCKAAGFDIISSLLF
jgi:hypothetical protein